MNVLATVSNNPAISCKRVEDEVGVSKSRANRILKKNKYYPYKFNIVQELHPGDAQKRVEFCQWYLNQIEEDENFGRDVIWTDESYVSSAGIFNRQNHRYWSDENKHIMWPRQQQGRFGVSVSCFIWNLKAVFVIYEGGLTAQRYLDIIRINLDNLSRLDHFNIERVYFQQDGAPAHNAIIVSEFLVQTFGPRYIGTRGPVPWPPRSPDLSILDFFLWAFLKDKIYQEHNNTVNELRHSIAEAFRQISAPHMINALNHLRRRCELCIQHNGQNFEQFL